MSQRLESVKILLLTRVHLKRVEEVYIQMVHGAWYIELMIISIALDAII